MIPYWMSRTQLLLGDDALNVLMTKNVLVVGLGGVGGICAEMIARAGVGKMTIVDVDTVDLSNANRQVAALHSTAGMPKAEVMAARLKDINPLLDLTVLTIYIKDVETDDLLNNNAFDYAVDCIDTLSPKVYFLKACLDRKIPIVSSLGAGGKLVSGGTSIYRQSAKLPLIEEHAIRLLRHLQWQERRYRCRYP